MERWLWGAVGVLALAVIGVFSYRYYQVEPQLPQVSAAVPSCDVQQGACTVMIQGVGEVTLEIAPRPIPVVTPLTFTVNTTIAGVRTAEIDFSGVDMNMGLNRFVLQTAAGGYEGTGMLPVCVRSRMSWEAKVMLKTETTLYVAPFRFVTVNKK